MSSLIFSRTNALRHSVPLALVFGSLASASARVHAADSDSLDPVQLDEITVSAPAVKVVEHDATRAPIESRTITARIQVDPQALRTEYGALMLKPLDQPDERWCCDHRRHQLLSIIPQ